MQKEEITKEFLLEGILSQRESQITYEQVCDRCKDELQNLRDEIDSDEEENLKLCDDILNQVIIEYEDYQYVHEKITGYTDYEVEGFYQQFEKEKDELENIEMLVSDYIQIINQMPGEYEYEVSFSSKSPSVYLKTNAKVTEDNIDNFEYLNAWNWEYENVYEEYGYDESKNIEIRLSDHDFGGFRKFEGFGDYMSYRKACLNYWKRG